MARKKRGSSSNEVTRHSNRKGGKRNQETVVQDRWEKKSESGRVVSDKFADKNEDIINSRPLRPLNQMQAEYIRNCKTKPYNIAIGYAGSSKTYIPTRIAIEMFLRNEIEKIVIVRPAVSDSKSLGFFGGDQLTKSKNWILPVLDVLEEFLGKNRVEYMLAKGDILPVPLETIKGRSLNDSFIIVDESEDLTKKEFIKCLTRLGKNSTMCFCGDILQQDIRGQSGLSFGLDLADDDSLQHLWGVVNFDEHEDIVRSDAVKETIIRLTDMGEM